MSTNLSASNVTNWNYTTLDAVTTVLSLGSVPVYILIVIVLVKYRSENYKSSYFTMFISLGVGDLLMIAVQYGTYRMLDWKVPGFVNWALYSQYSRVYAHVIGIVVWYLLQVQYIGVLCLVFNRFTAVVFPLQQNKIWNKSKTKTVLFLAWFVPLVIVSPLIVQKEPFGTYLSLKNGEMVAGIKFNDKEIHKVYFTFAALFDGLFLNTVVFIMYVLIFKTLLKLRKQVVPFANAGLDKQQQETEKKNRFKKDLRMVAASLIVWLTMLSYAIVLMLSATTTSGKNVYFDWLTVMADIFSVINPYSLLLTSDKVRQNCVTLIKCQ